MAIFSLMDPSSPIVQIPLVVSPIFLLAGLALMLFPPKKINGIYGYRTKRSMANQESWDYAQSRSGKALIYFSLAFFCTILIDSILPDIPETLAVVISLSLMIAGLIILIAQMEKALKDKFGE